MTVVSNPDLHLILIRTDSFFAKIQFRYYSLHYFCFILDRTSESEHTSLDRTQTQIQLVNLKTNKNAGNMNYFIKEILLLGSLILIKSMIISGMPDKPIWDFSESEQTAAAEINLHFISLCLLH